MEVTKTEIIEVKETVHQAIISSEQSVDSGKVEEHNSSQVNGDSYITAESSTSTHTHETKEADFMDVEEPVVLVPQSQTPPNETTGKSSNPLQERVLHKSSPFSGPKSGVLDISQFKSISRPKSRNGCTIPQSPYFATNHRLRSRNLSIEEQTQQQQQHTKPNNNNTSINNKPLTNLAKRAATKPMSPKFSKLHNKSRQISQTKLSPKALRNKYTFKNSKYQTKNPVKVKEFKFLTDKPRSNKGEDGSPSNKPSKHLSRVPRFPPPVPFRPGQVPTTVPKPFHFASDIRFGNSRDRLDNESCSNDSRKH